MFVWGLQLFGDMVYLDGKKYLNCLSQVVNAAKRETIIPPSPEWYNGYIKNSVKITIPNVLSFMSFCLQKYINAVYQLCVINTVKKLASEWKFPIEQTAALCHLNK